MNIINITAREIIDSRGNPTVEAEVHCNNGWGRASVPSGASTGEHEAHELRDGGKRFGGKGVRRAVAHITDDIKEVLLGISADDQFRIDETLIDLDGTPNKNRLGANAILAVSLAAAHAAAAVRHLPLWRHINDIAHNPAPNLPLPMFNVLNGGQHATNSADFQEYMVVPIGATSYAQAIQITAEIFHALKQILGDRGMRTTVGDEGGFAPQVDSNTAMLDLLLVACEKSGYQPGIDVAFALDVAASEFYETEAYSLATEHRSLSPEEMIDYLAQIARDYPIVSIEDGLDQDAWSDWTALQSTLPDTQLVGDDLLVTNQTRLERALAENAGNAILIKPNQIGTLTETIRTIQAAQAANWNTIVSHRSGETEDVTITHLAVGTGAGQIKTGSVSRGGRTAKHNELLRIEDTYPALSLAHPITIL